MPYTAPTVLEFKVRFPAFAVASNAAVQVALNEAAGYVDETWDEADFAPARMLYTAHILTLDGHGTNAQVAGFQASGVRSFSSGQLSVTFDSDAGASEFGSTSYGRRFLAMLRRNHPAILAVNTQVEVIP